MPDTINLQVNDRTVEVVTEGDNLVINTIQTQTVSKTATRQELSKLHRSTLETYATNLGLELPFETFETRGEIIEAILAAREETQ
jgi:virulence-associated protein VagC